MANCAASRLLCAHLWWSFFSMVVTSVSMRNGWRLVELGANYGNFIFIYLFSFLLLLHDVTKNTIALQKEISTKISP
jgi:hypothetical protein